MNTLDIKLAEEMKILMRQYRVKVCYSPKNDSIETIKKSFKIEML